MGLRETVIENEFREVISGVCKGGAGVGEALSKRFVCERLLAIRKYCPMRVGRLNRNQPIIATDAGDANAPFGHCFLVVSLRLGGKRYDRAAQNCSDPGG